MSNPVREQTRTMSVEVLIDILMVIEPKQVRTSEETIVHSAVWSELEARGVLVWKENAEGDEDPWVGTVKL